VNISDGEISRNCLMVFDSTGSKSSSREKKKRKFHIINQSFYSVKTKINCWFNLEKRKKEKRFSKFNKN
jgi:hypothetical protein